MRIFLLPWLDHTNTPFKSEFYYWLLLQHQIRLHFVILLTPTQKYREIKGKIKIYFSPHKPDWKKRKIMEETYKFNLNIRIFQPKPKMDPFECHNFEEAIYNKIIFTRIQTQGYYKLIYNMQRVGNLISNNKLEFKRVPRQTAKTTELPQELKPSMKLVMIHWVEEEKLRDIKESSFIILISSHEGGVTKPFENPITWNNDRVDTTHIPSPTKCLIWPRRRSYWNHSTKG